MTFHSVHSIITATSHYELESALLFTPGRASYVTSGPEAGAFALNLTAASAQRAEVAAKVFDDQLYSTALFAGGYPGVAQNWPEEHTSAIHNSEAALMAEPLKTRLSSQGWGQAAIAGWVKQQGESNNSIGDVLHSIENGFLDPNDFHRDNVAHGISLVAGKLHGIRFGMILTKALGIDKERIVRVPIHDPYGTPATEFRGREHAPIALAKEYAAIVFTAYVLRDVRPGEIEDLRDAEQRFNQIAAKAAG